MSNLIEKLGFKKRIHVGISLSSNNFIELVCVDKLTKNVIKYASGNIKYNNAIREIIDYEEFAEVVEGLFDEAGLDPSECAVTLNLPTVYFGITSLNNEAETPYIIENIQSEIEDLYVFKRNEPIISYSKLENTKLRGQKNIAFGAIQTKTIVKIVEIFDSLNCDLVRIDNSYSSLLKAVQFCDRFNKYVEKEEKTTILLATANSCATFYLEGNIIVDSFEEPLAVKSFSADEVYATVSKIAANSIEKNNPNTLLIISETDEINSELLSSKLNFNGNIDFINRTINSEDQFIDISNVNEDVDTSMISYLTIEAVGAAVADFDEYPLNINFLPPERINNNIVNVGPYEINFNNFIIITIGFAIIAGFALSLIIGSIFSAIANSKSDETNRLNSQTTVFKNRLNDSNKHQTKNIFPVLKQLIDNNTAIINVYTALSTDIPDSIYIKKFVTNDEGGIGIIGEAKTSESVETFVKSLSEKNPDLTLSKLSINSEYDAIPSKIPNGFTFEIKTLSHNISIDNSTENKDINSNRRPEIRRNNVPISDVKSNNTGNLTPPPPII